MALRLVRPTGIEPESIKNDGGTMADDKITERYLSTGELMDTLSISRSTVYRLMARGLPNIMVESVHRFPINQVRRSWSNAALC